MSQWVRLWEDMPTDPKWRVVARRAGRPLSEVLAVFVFMLTNASKSQDRGTLANWDDEDVAAALDLEGEHVAAIRAAMQGKTLEGERLTGWERRQPAREDHSTDRVKAFREKRNAMKRNETQGNAPDTDTEAETDKKESATAASSRAAAGEPIDEKEVERRCVQATGWHSTTGLSAILDLIAEGHSLEDRILPLLREIAAELKSKGQAPPRVWAFAMKAIRDPTRQPQAAEKEVPMVWVPVGSPAWLGLIAAGRKESYLRGLLKPGPGGIEGFNWPISDLPKCEAPKQGRAA